MVAAKTVLGSIAFMIGLVLLIVYLTTGWGVYSALTQTEEDRQFQAALKTLRANEDSSLNEHASTCLAEASEFCDYKMRSVYNNECNYSDFKYKACEDGRVERYLKQRGLI